LLIAFDTLRRTDARRLEVMLNRNPPFGNQASPVLCCMAVIWLISLSLHQVLENANRFPYFDVNIE
jgi:hypothetical protein